jgi:hypothetical protein
MSRQSVVNFAVATTLSLSACVDQTNYSTTQTNLKTSGEQSSLNVKFYTNSVWVDSLIHIKPLTSSDSLRFIIHYADTISNCMQRQIFELDKVNTTIKGTASKKWIWFTQLVNQSDSTKDFGLYIILRGGEAIENGRFRFKEYYRMQSVNNNPTISNAFVEVGRWKADTVAFEE